MENWFDDEVPDRPNVEVEDELFAFEAGPQVIVNASNGNGKLEPLPQGFEDLLGDRGVIMKLIKRTNTSAAAGSSSSSSSTGGPSRKENSLLHPSKEKPYLEFHYAGYTLTKEGERGENFDKSTDGYALVVKLNFPWVAQGNLIRGLDTALRRLSPGDEAEIRVKSPYAYGEDGCAPNIEPNTDLSFDVTVIDVRSAPKKKGVETDDTETELSRLETVRKEREAALARRQEEEAMKNASKAAKADRVAALREKLANKQNNQGKKKGKKKKK